MKTDPHFFPKPPNTICCASSLMGSRGLNSCLESVWTFLELFMGFPSGSDGKESACSAGNLGSIPGLRRSLGVRNSNPLQYSCLENPMDRGAWQAAGHGVTQSRTHCSDLAHRVNYPFPGFRLPPSRAPRCWGDKAAAEGKALKHLAVNCD